MSEPRAIPFAHLAGQRNDCPALSDAEREAQISLAWQALCAAATVDLQRAAFAQMRDLIGQRSPEQIERLERERGLR